MSANDYYNAGQHQDKGYYPPQGPPGQGGYYPQEPQQAYGGYGQPPPQGGYYPQQGGYQPQPQPQTVIIVVARILDAWPVWLVFCAAAALRKSAIAFSKQPDLSLSAGPHMF
ncbi:hypothetical protein VNI00_002773 [Paramarasmius palmivorus]|uniref:Uncharacterized protein n=1 Tax=Paramarasmius palmivorus TaxID=297713 RepID=A0AAW0DVB0_9AGAR